MPGRIEEPLRPKCASSSVLAVASGLARQSTPRRVRCRAVVGVARNSSMTIRETGSVVQKIENHRDTRAGSTWTLPDNSIAAGPLIGSS